MSRSSDNPPAVVVTGASTGIGAACAEELARRGFRVFAGVRSEADARRIEAQSLASLSPLMLDVTAADSIAAAVRHVAAAVGDAGLAGLVNNAGIAVAGPLEILPLDVFRRQLEVNLFGQLAVTQAFMPLLRAARGRIVNMGSINGALAPPFLGAYAVSKFALEAVTDAMRAELRRAGVAVSIIDPGAVQTPIWEKSLAAADQLARDVPPEALALYETEMNAMRAATRRIAAAAVPVDKVVRAVVHALSARRPKARYYLTMQTWFLFGPFRMLPEGVRDWFVRRAIGLP